MSGQARIVLFTWIRGLGSPQGGRSVELATWNGPPHKSRDQAASRRAGPGLVGWRLIGANNRELGRGSLPSWRADEAYQAVREAQVALDLMVTHLWVDAAGSWFWSVTLASEPIAVSSRGYRRQRECVYNVEQFREQFPTAQTVASHVLRPASTSRGLIVRPPITASAVAAHPEPAVAGQTREVTTEQKPE